jgi:hypothetical protein
MFSIPVARRRELHVLSTEPAIARVVAEDEHGKRKTYFISRATVCTENSVLLIA